LKLKFSEILL